MSIFIRISIAIIFLNSSLVFGQKNVLEKEKEILDQILAESRYDPRTRAFSKLNGSFSDEPVVVVTNIYFRSIEYICSKKLEWKVQLTFRQQWNDSRLEFDDSDGKIKYIKLDDVKRIWSPDIFFSNSRSSQSHAELHPNQLVRIYPNGNVLFSTRITLTLSCPMNFKHYPFDKQVCSLQLASYGFTTDDIVLTWKEEDPIQVTRNLHLPRMTLESFEANYCTSKTKTGNYSCLKADFKFDRELTGYLTNWFLPTAIITFVSFVSFWLRLDKSARIITLVVTLLLLYLHVIAINYQLPKVSYSTAMDCWASTCLLFIIGAFIEYGVVKCVNSCKKCHNKKTDFSKDCKKSNGNNCEEGDAVAMKPLVEDGHENHVEEGVKEYTVNDVSNRRNYVQKWRQSPIGYRIDSIAAIIFPILFLLYIITFFCYQKMETLKD